MAWVRFSRPFEWSPQNRPGVTIVFAARDYSVTRACEKAALAEGAGERIPAPPKGDHGGA